MVKRLVGPLAAAATLVGAVLVGSLIGYVVGRTGTATAEETRSAALATLALVPAANGYHLVEVCDGAVSRRFDPIHGVLVPTGSTKIAADSAWLDHREIALAALGGSALITVPRLRSPTAHTDPEQKHVTSTSPKQMAASTEHREGHTSGMRDHMATLLALISGYSVGYVFGREDRLACGSRAVADHLEQTENWKSLAGWYAAAQLTALDRDGRMLLAGTRMDAAITGIDTCAPEYGEAVRAMRARLEEKSYTTLVREEWATLYWLQSAAIAVQALVPHGSRSIAFAPPPCTVVRATLADKIAETGAPFTFLVQREAAEKPEPPATPPATAQPASRGL